MLLSPDTDADLAHLTLHAGRRKKSGWERGRSKCETILLYF